MDDAVDRERGAQIQERIGPDIAMARSEPERVAKGSDWEFFRNLGRDPRTQKSKGSEAAEKGTGRSPQGIEREERAEGESVYVRRGEDVESDFQVPENAE